jgi:hypothetical protein
MQVQMEDELPTAPLNVKGQPVTRPGNSQILRDLLSHKNQFGNNGPIRFREVIDTSDMFFGYEKNVDRRMEFMSLNATTESPR